MDSIHTSLLITAHGEWDQYAARERQEGDVRESLEGHDARVIVDGSLRSKRGFDALVPFVGFTGFAYAADSQLCRQFIGGTQFSIHQLLQGKFVGRLFRK